MTTRQNHFWKIANPVLYVSSLIALIVGPHHPTLFWIWFAIALPVLTYREWFVRDAKSMEIAKPAKE